MITIKDLARELGIGVSTVSMALNNNPRIKQKTRDLVANKAKELGYIKNMAAADLQKGKSNLILLVVNDPARSYFAEVINSIQREVAKHGYDFLIATTFEGHDETAKRYIREHRADGVIIYTSTIEDSFISENASSELPIVLLGRELKSDYVISFKQAQDEQAEAIDYLVEKGHQRIAFVKGSPYSLGTLRKFRGYMYGLCQHELTVDQRLIFDAKGSERSNGYAITEEIIPLIGSIDAIIYSNDEIAFGGMDCLKKHNIRIPEDISIIGGNNSPMAEYVSPKLTSTGAKSDETQNHRVIVDALITIIEDKVIPEYLYELSDRQTQFMVYERETVLDKRKIKSE